MFVIGSFNRPEDPFVDNLYIGFYDDALVGIGTFFGRFGSIVINTQSMTALDAMVDHFVGTKCGIEHVPAFRRYALPTVERLRTHGIEPHNVRDETVFLLVPESFVDHSLNNAMPATLDDVDDMITVERLAEDEDVNAEITEKERRQVFPEYEFLLRENGVLVSKACIHGYSEHYAQIGGVVTHPTYQGKGYAKQVVSAVCAHWIQKGKQIILFCKNDNVPAIKVYRALGFQPIDAFAIAMYDSSDA